MKQPEFVLLMWYLSEKYHKEDTAAIMETRATTPNGRNLGETVDNTPPLRQDLFPTPMTTNLNPQDLMDELATNRHREAELQKTIKDIKS